MNKKGLLALSPLILFITLYLALSIAAGDFYKVPMTVVFLISSIYAIAISGGFPLKKRIDIFSKGASSSSLMLMLWIYVLAGAFAASAKGMGAIDSTVNLAISVLPASMLLPGLFVASCFISLSIGTSVGTVVALVPIAAGIAHGTGQSVPLMTAVIVGGAYFGDNLSFISDTTIASTRSQKCKMNDKFKANLWIAIPAAVIAVVLFTVVGNFHAPTFQQSQASAWLVTPYLLVVFFAIIGVNVLVVLSIGIMSCIIFSLLCTDIPLINMCSFMGDGIDGMGNLIIVTLLASGLLEVIRHNGGIQYIIQILTDRISGVRGAQACISLVVSIVNICTANNTVAIITVGQIAQRISKQFNLDNRKVASLLDTCSCIVQCIIPYGAQALLASGIAQVTPVAFFPYLYYAWALAFMVALSIIFRFPRYKTTPKP